MPDNILITGVSSGIGHGLAKRFLERGATVYGVSRRKPDDLAKSSSFHFGQMDLGALEKIPEGLIPLLEGLQNLDLVVLNAGILGKIADLKETDLESLKKILDVNLWANKVVLDTLFSKGLSIKQVVAISSGAAVSAFRGWGGYSISKAALNMLVGLYAAERTETHFCAFAPGIVDTAMQDQLCQEPNDPRFQSLQSLRSAKGTVSMPRPEVVAEKLTIAMKKALELPSGSYADLQSLTKKWF